MELSFENVFTCFASKFLKHDILIIPDSVIPPNPTRCTGKAMVKLIGCVFVLMLVHGITIMLKGFCANREEGRDSYSFT